MQHDPTRSRPAAQPRRVARPNLIERLRDVGV
jgi:hypothetical protein